MTPAARRRRAISVPVASMGDIAFLLIIFFMICSNFVKDAEINMDPPDAPALAVMEESLISVVIDENSTLYVQGLPVAEAGAVETLVAGLLAARGADAPKHVLFKCDRNVDKAVFEPVLDAISQAGGIILAAGERQE